MVTIPGPVAHDIKVTGIEHFYQAEQLWLRVRVRNDGTVIEHPGGDLRVYDGDGREVTTAALQMDSLYPGTEGGILVPMDRGMGRSGQYRVSVTLHQAEQLPVQAEFPVLLSRHEVIVADAARYQKIKEQSTDDGMVLNREQVLLWSTVGSAALLMLTLGGAWLRRWRRPSALVAAAAGLPVLSSLSMVGTETDPALWLSRSTRRRVGRRH